LLLLLLLLALLIAALFGFQFAAAFSVKGRTIIGRIRRICHGSHRRPMFGIGRGPEAIIATKITPEGFREAIIKEAFANALGQLWLQIMRKREG
jgi:hypothetical protein